MKKLAVRVQPDEDFGLGRLLFLCRLPAVAVFSQGLGRGLIVAAMF
jgi:hypothetical protein